ncbi:MAG: DNA polymerase IV [Thermodesulfobacteriota bacterium]
MPKNPRQIIHCDMDAFYASVEMLDSPELVGKPVIVGGTSNRGVVSAASYEARRYGVRSAMPLVTARKLCPQGVFLPVRMGRYRELSEEIMAIFLRFTPLVEPLSLDEAFLDVTASRALLGNGETIAKEIKRLVREETGLTVSAGVATNKLTAKIVSDLHKPDGLTIVPPGQEREFLAPLPIGRLWGVGSATAKALSLMGVRTIGDLARMPLALLTAKLGTSHGEHLHLVAQGIDEREVEPEQEAKSIGNEETFETDLRERQMIERELLALSTKVARRLRRHEVCGRTITLKVKYHDFKQITRSVTLATATCDEGEIYAAIKTLLIKTEAGRIPLRLLGVSVSSLAASGEGQQLSLFATTHKKGGRQQELHAAVDRITGKYGQQAIKPATLLEGEEEMQ